MDTTGTLFLDWVVGLWLVVVDKNGHGNGCCLGATIMIYSLYTSDDLFYEGWPSVWPQLVNAWPWYIVKVYYKMESDDWTRMVIANGSWLTGGETQAVGKGWWI